MRKSLDHGLTKHPHDVTLTTASIWTLAHTEIPALTNMDVMQQMIYSIHNKWKDEQTDTNMVSATDTTKTNKWTE